MRGFVRQMTGSVHVAPMSVYDELARDCFALATQSIFGKKGLFNQIESYSQHLQGAAFNVADLMTNKFRSDPVLRHYVRERAVLEKHGVQVPPIP